MKDTYLRDINYMRVSITDRCNLRCRYCMPHEVPFIPHENILRYEEIQRICKCASELGIRTIKITGGEPLVRKGCLDLIASLKQLPLVENVTLTTNGVFLEEHLDRLQEIGVTRINISLDTLVPQKYETITTKDAFHRVWNALVRAVEMGFKVKLNFVPLKGYNDDEILDVVKLAETMKMDIRFIEMMPMGLGKEFKPVSGGDILAMIQHTYSDLVESDEKRGFGPAIYYASQKLKGNIGFIDAVSHKFCDTCNRVRITSEGYLKTCLYFEEGVDLRSAMRNGASDAAVKQMMAGQIMKKPKEHEFHLCDTNQEQRVMSQIGG